MNMRMALLATLTLGADIAAAAEFELAAGQDVVGATQVIEARYEDTFVSLARAYNVGFEALRRANPDVDEWLPGEGTPILLPTQYVLPRAPRHGIVVNLPELRLYYFPDADGRRVITHPISIGRMDWSTPLGRTTVVGKSRNPAWYPPQSIRDEHAARNDPLPPVVPPGPDNPLGAHALRLGLAGGSYLIHGTNKPSGVGMRVTHGCIRMFPEDIESLFERVGPGTPVYIVNQPYKLGWRDDALYLEAHLPLAEPPATASAETPVPDILDAVSSPATELTRLYVDATEQRAAQVEWDLAELVMLDARGIPQSVAVVAVTADAEETPAAPVVPASFLN